MKKAKKEYISKRLVSRGSKRVFKKAASRALSDNGYVIVAKDGWVVKESIDGTIERIRRIDSPGTARKFALD
jgi:hypothetical protein